jgi:hypothetical protein
MSGVDIGALQKAITEEQLVGAGLTVEPGANDRVMTLAFAGEATSVTARGLAIVMKHVHEEALRANVSAVHVDLRHLAFMNSSSLKAFVTWVTSLSEVAEASRYRISFKRGRGSFWQRRSLATLRCFAPDLIEVDESEDDATQDAPKGGNT